MNSFPTTVVDNFLNDPDKLREYALSLDYHPDPEGLWPGLRSRPVEEINPELFHALCHKIFALFFDLDSKSDLVWRVSMGFQKVSSDYVANFVHQDHPDSICNCVLYLTPNAPLHSGTNLYRPKNNWDMPDEEHYMEIKRRHYKQGITSPELKQAVIDYNNYFEPTLEIHNLYNRLAIFDSGSYHGAASYEGFNSEDRLFLVAFVTHLSHHDLPIRNKDIINNL